MMTIPEALWAPDPYRMDACDNSCPVCAAIDGPNGECAQVAFHARDHGTPCSCRRHADSQEAVKPCDGCGTDVAGVDLCGECAARYE